MKPPAPALHAARFSKSSDEKMIAFIDATVWACIAAGAVVPILLWALSVGEKHNKEIGI